MGDETSIEADTYSYRILLLEMFLGKRPTLGLNVLELQFVILANHDQNVLVFILDLLKVCLYVKLESSVLQDMLSFPAFSKWAHENVYSAF